MNCKDKTELKELRAANKKLTLALTIERLNSSALAFQRKTLVDAITYSTEYLDSNPLNSIGAGSKAHVELRNALSAAHGVEDA